MATRNKGGRPQDDFVADNFVKVGEMNPKTKRWPMQCKYCLGTASPIEHRDSHCISHISKPELCPNAPADTRKEARRLLMKKGRIEDIDLSDVDSEAANKEKADGQPNNAVAKKGKSNSGNAVKQGAIEAFADRALTKDEEDQANVRMLRFFIHGNIPLSASENPLFKKWLAYLRPSFNPATRYVLTERYIPAEEARAFNEDMRRLEGRNTLTYLMDGWEDLMRRSIYGSMLAEVGEFPVVLGLEELTGIRATADNLIEISNKALKKKNVSPVAIIAVCTDNPTTMQAFRRKWTSPTANYWILPLACFMHGINTIIGKITQYPVIKSTITKNTRIVSFFNSSHYWGGQLEVIAAEKKVTRGLKTNTESRFYALILQALSIKEHRAALTELCQRDDANQSIGGLTPVSRDIVDTVFDMNRWRLTEQLIRICKPLVNIIGDVESCDSTLADCMLQLIWAHREVDNLKLVDGEDEGFLSHAKETLNRQFHAMNTDYHWLALFLHPLCRKLAISSSSHSRKLEDAYRITLDIALRWKWLQSTAEKLLCDIKAYFHSEGPFQGGKADARDWWKSLLIVACDHPIKILAIKMMSIVPHTAEIERFFPNLGGIGSVKRSGLSVSHLDTLGSLRNHYVQQLHEAGLAMGKIIHRKHAHMHTLAERGIDVERTKTLIESYSSSTVSATPPLADSNMVEMAEVHVVSPEELDAEYDKLEDSAFTADDGDKLGVEVRLSQVFDLSLLDKLRAGDRSAGEEPEIEVQDSVPKDSEKWDRDSLLKSLNI